MLTNKTHDPQLTSWVESANDPGSDFPIQNLPYGAFDRADDPDFVPHIGVAIGDMVFDITRAVDMEFLPLPEEVAFDFTVGELNGFLAAGADVWAQVRAILSDLLRSDNPTLRDDDDLRAQLLVPMSDVELAAPVGVGDYTDFYASIHHATNVGSMFRPDNPLLPNYTHVPIGYHGRASSLMISGTPIIRPKGQLKPDDGPPEYGQCKLLDYEMEMGFFVGRGNDLGDTINIGDVRDHLFGMVIVNDWSARDIQKWEYQPLGPFNAKNFATTVSPWIVTLEALAPFRIAGPPREGDQPNPLPYLQAPDDEHGHWGIDMEVEVLIASEQMRRDGAKPVMISRGNFNEMYWTIAQMLVHHASSGCNMQPGDLLATGTISNASEDSRGCLLERTWRGENPIDLPDGTQRKFLLDGDEVIMRAYCEREGARRIGFGECRGVIAPASA